MIQKDIPSPWIRIINIVKQLYYPRQSTYQMQSLSYQITNDIFAELKQKNLNLYENTKDPEYPKHPEKGKNRAGGSRLHNFRLN